LRLSYAIDNNKTYSTNGTWRGEIPVLKVNMPYTVRDRVFFKDDLNYNVTKSGCSDRLARVIERVAVETAN
jgi:hypothetical protein